MAKSVTADQNGHYRISGIVPVDYKVFGWEELESGASEDDDFMKPFEKLKVEIILEEGAKATKDVIVIAKAVMQDEKARAQ